MLDVAVRSSLLVLVAGASFFAVGLRRRLARLTWRMAQLEAIQPKRVARLKAGAGDMAPAFELPRRGGGPAVTLEAYRGRPVLLVFTQDECGPCRELKEPLRRFVAESGHAVVAIHLPVAPEGPWHRRWLAGRSGSVDLGPVVTGLDAKSRVRDEYGVEASPTAVLVDATGRIVARNMVNTWEHLLATSRGGEVDPG